jgi:hypothetical protein
MLTTQQLNVKIRSISRTTAKLRDDIQVVLCNAAAHAYVHGDVSSFTKLFEATSGVNRKRIAKWVQSNGFAMLNKDGTFKLNKSARKDADFESGEAVVAYLTNEVPAWYVDEESAAQITKELDVAARLKSLTSQIKGASASNTVVKVDFKAAREALDALYAAISEVA